MDTFNFPMHTLAAKYPESSAKMTFGRGYEFASKPKGPDQLTYTLAFKGMWFFLNSNGTLDLATRPTLNMAVLENFYVAHRLYEKFIYPHPALGNVTVRFDVPLDYKIMEGGNGLVEPFTIQLLTQP
ncbi:hypothetical protein NKJ88_06055 [Mesorhizobium sp. M0016]|uniref:hypothetical protein n=1 Tax=Mesorhizobium sp. M0016 TaxID=2956843 RepID=UPI00333C355B